MLYVIRIVLRNSILSFGFKPILRSHQGAIYFTAVFVYAFHISFKNQTSLFNYSRSLSMIFKQINYTTIAVGVNVGEIQL